MEPLQGLGVPAQFIISQTLQVVHFIVQQHHGVQVLAGHVVIVEALEREGTQVQGLGVVGFVGEGSVQVSQRLLVITLMYIQLGFADQHRHILGRNE